MSNITERSAGAGWTWRYPETTEPFAFEIIDKQYWLNLGISHWKLSLYVGAIYLVTIFVLQQWMKNRPAMNLKRALFWWNLGLGLFSIAGFARTLPTLWQTVGSPNGVHRLVCKRDYADVPIVFWGLMFGISKFVELGDTVFLVLRKKPVVFLQWYHHLVTLNFVWMVGPLLEPNSTTGVVLNYGVHSLMYPYFALMALGIKVPKRVANFITTCQLGQMIIVFVANCVTAYYYLTGADCYRHPFSIQVLTVIFGSFVLLFGKLFIDLVIKSGEMKRQEKCDIAKNE